MANLTCWSRFRIRCECSEHLFSKNKDFGVQHVWTLTDLWALDWTENARSKDHTGKTEVDNLCLLQDLLWQNTYCIHYQCFTCGNVFMSSDQRTRAVCLQTLTLPVTFHPCNVFLLCMYIPLVQNFHMVSVLATLDPVTSYLWALYLLILVSLQTLLELAHVEYAHLRCVLISQFIQTPKQNESQNGGNQDLLSMYIMFNTAD